MKNAICFVFISIILFCLCSCKDAMQTMIDDYNAGFGVATIDDITPEKLPGDEGFDPRSMLEKQYLVPEDSYLCLTAPPTCNKYNWQIWSKIEEEFNETVESRVILPELVNLEDRYFKMYIPTSGLKRDKTYLIKLEVTKNGEKYNAESELVLYDPFYENR